MCWLDFRNPLSGAGCTVCDLSCADCPPVRRAAGGQSPGRHTRGTTGSVLPDELDPPHRSSRLRMVLFLLLVSTLAAGFVFVAGVVEIHGEHGACLAERVALRGVSSG